MNTLVEDGLGLMVLGMGFVFLFLLILIVATTCMSTLLNKFFPEAELKTLGTTTQVPVVTAVDTQLVAVITSAVHQHRAKNK